MNEKKTSGTNRSEPKAGTYRNVLGTYKFGKPTNERKTMMRWIRVGGNGGNDINFSAVWLIFYLCFCCCRFQSTRYGMIFKL